MAKWHKALTKPVKRLRAWLYKRKWMERKVCRGGKNPDKTFYVIRSRIDTWGLIACYNHVLGHIKLALEQGYIPVVDMQNYPNTYLDPGKLHQENAWEYYFYQPTGYTLEEAYRSCHVILMDGMPPKEAHPRGQGKLYLDYFNRKAGGFSGPDPSSDGGGFSCGTDYDGSGSRSDQEAWGTETEKEIRYNTKIIRENMQIRREVQAHIEEQYEKLFPGGEKVLGVLCRGTDISLRRPSGHSVMPRTEEMISRAGELMEQWGCTGIFLTTEEAAAVEQFREAFGDRVFFTECARYGDTGDKLLADIPFDRKNDRYLRGLEYLTNIVLLSRCDCLLGVYVGGTTGAMEMNGGGYEHVEIMDLGVYE